MLWLILVYRKNLLPKDKKKWSTKTEINGSLNFITGTSKTYNTFSNYESVYQAGSDAGIRLTQTFNYRFNKYHQFTIGAFGQHASALPTISSLPTNTSTASFADPFTFINTAEQDIYYPGTDLQNGEGQSLKVYQKLYYMQRLMGGAFAEYRINIKDKILLTMGMRYDQVVDSRALSKRPSYGALL